jgi:hypothetical protein
LCGGTCCLSGGCTHYNSTTTPDTCSCPSGNTCGTAGCCPSGAQCGTINGEQACYQCPDAAPSLCGKFCCTVLHSRRVLLRRHQVRGVGDDPHRSGRRARWRPEVLDVRYLVRGLSVPRLPDRLGHVFV